MDEALIPKNSTAASGTVLFFVSETPSRITVG